MYQPYLLLQPQIERGLRTEQGSASLKSCIFTSKDFLTSMSFPLNPTTSPLHGSNPGQWRCFCAAETVDSCLNLAEARVSAGCKPGENLLSMFFHKCSFSPWQDREEPLVLFHGWRPEGNSDLPEFPSSVET